MTANPNAAARCGDLVIIHQRLGDSRDGEPGEYDRLWLGQVTSVSPDGGVGLYRPAGRFTGETDWRGRPVRGRPLPGVSFERALIRSAQQVDVEGAMATAACHVWLGHEDLVRGYNSLHEVKDALRPHLPGQPGRARLHDAARAWETARLAAVPMLHEAVRPYGGARFRGLTDAYDAAVAAANTAYRQQYAEGAWAQSRAA